MQSCYFTIVRSDVALQRVRCKGPRSNVHNKEILRIKKVQKMNVLAVFIPGRMSRLPSLAKADTFYLQKV